MAKKYLDGDGLLYLWQKITNQFVKKDGTKVLSTNDYTTDEKEKLAGLEAGATKTVVDTELSATSTNPVQNKVINTALAGKVNTVSGKGLSTNDLTDDLLNKLNNTATKVEEIATVGGEPNIIETVKVNGEILDVTDKTVDIVIPESDQADWSQNDETAASYVKNRPFYETSTNVTILPAAEVTTGMLYGDWGQGFELPEEHMELLQTSIPYDFKLTVGDEVFEGNYNDYMSESSGNLNIVTNAYGTIEISWSYMYFWDLEEPITTNIEYIISISGEVKKIDEKFLPDTVVLESELTSKNYQNETQVNTLIANAIGDITGISYEIVTSLPETGEAGVIYLVSNNGANPNIYDEYIYTNGAFEKIGTTDVDLSGYVQDSDLVAITNSEIDTLIAG